MCIMLIDFFDQNSFRLLKMYLIKKDEKTIFEYESWVNLKDYAVT